jgi:hypothetical protein
MRFLRFLIRLSLLVHAVSLLFLAGLFFVGGIYLGDDPDTAFSSTGVLLSPVIAALAVFLLWVWRRLG